LGIAIASTEKSDVHTFEKIETTPCRQPMSTTVCVSAEAQLFGSMAIGDDMLPPQTQDQFCGEGGGHHIEFSCLSCWLPSTPAQIIEATFKALELEKSEANMNVLSRVLSKTEDLTLYDRIF
jgi:hypothetical protein